MRERFQDSGELGPGEGDAEEASLLSGKGDNSSLQTRASHKKRNEFSYMAIGRLFFPLQPVRP